MSAGAATQRELIADVRRITAGFTYANERERAVDLAQAAERLARSVEAILDAAQADAGDAVDPAEDDPRYLAYLAEREADRARQLARSGRAAPMKNGTPMSANLYFCRACWKRGDEIFGHAKNEGLCEDFNRGPFDPR